MKSIRDEYAAQGVEKYYRKHGDAYENPHFEQVKTLLEANKSRIDYAKILDLACGGGEVTLILRGFGFSDSTGCDPFTARLFEKNVGQRCLKLSFDDIVKGKLDPSVFSPFSAVVCSFGMHLCDEKKLFPLVERLFNVTENIVILTPHKRPELEKLSNAALLFTDFALTERGKKVFLKSYGRKL